MNIFRHTSILLLCILAASLAPQLRAQIPVTDHVEMLGPVPDNIRKEFISGDGRNVAWLTNGAAPILILNGRPDPVFSAIKSAPIISPDGKRMAYKVDADGGAKRAVVVDGKMGPAFESVNNDSIRFSPDSTILSYTAGDPGKTLLIQNGKVIGEGSDIRSDAVTSRDFKHLAYKVAIGDRRAIMLDGQPGPLLTQIDNGSINFSPNGDHLVYVATAGADNSGKQTVYLDGKPGETYEQVSGLDFSPDGQHLVYVADEGGKQRVVLDGKPGPEYDSIDPYFLRFAPDGTVGYRAQAAHRTLLVVGGVPAGEAGGILDWASAGKRTAFISRTAESWWVNDNGKKLGPYDQVAAPVALSPDGLHLVYAAEKGGHWSIFLDGQEVSNWDHVAQPPVWSANGSHWGCAVERGSHWFILVDGKPDGPYDWFLWGGPQFSPDGSRWAYAARTQGLWSVILDGKPVAQSDEPGPSWLRFSADGRHFACAIKDAGGWRMMVDETPGPPFDRLFDKVPDFRPDGSLDYVAIRGKTLYRISHGQHP